MDRQGRERESHYGPGILLTKNVGIEYVLFLDPEQQPDAAPPVQGSLPGDVTEPYFEEE
jgi:hypothetical protein